MSFYYPIEDELNNLPTAATALKMSKDNEERMREQDLKIISKKINEAIEKAETHCVSCEDLYDEKFIEKTLIAKGYKVKITFEYPYTVCDIDWREEDI